MSDKQKIISDIYFDKAGYGSRKTTLEDAKKKEPTIKKEDVENFFRKNVEIKAKPEGITPSQPLTIITLIRLICSLWVITILMRNKNS